MRLVFALLLAATAAAESGPGLIGAVKRGDGGAVRALLAQGADVRAREADGSTALHWAAHQDNLEIAQLLIAAGADPNAVTRYNITPAWHAATNGSAAMLQRLLDAGVDPNSTAEEGQTLLMTAALNGTAAPLRLLLARGAQVNAAEPYKGQTALMWAASNGNAEAAELLIEFGAEVHARSKAGFTPLLFAVRNNRIAAARVLLAHGANVNDLAPDRTSALNMAIVNAYYEMASVLLDHGADPNLPDDRASPLHIIAWLRKPGATGSAGVGNTANGPPNPVGNVTSLELARKLLEYGANPNVRVTWTERTFGKEGGTARNPPGIALGRHLLTYTGATAFYVAAKNGDAPLMRLLAEGGADPTIPTRYGITPLMVAAGMDTWEGETPGPYTGVSEKERLEAVKLALELGNDIHARTNFGDYPMIGDTDYTLLYYPLNIDDLLDLGVGDPRWNGCTALHGAVISNQPSIVQFLIDHGAQVDARNQLGWTPLKMSRGVFLANAKREFPEIEKILVKAHLDQGIPLPD
jgi:ankyrin repeat protein